MKSKKNKNSGVQEDNATGAPSYALCLTYPSSVYKVSNILPPSKCFHSHHSPCLLSILFPPN